jgi:hypothetical protein
VPPVQGLGVQMPHAPGEPRRRGLDDQVVVVAHQYVAVRPR